MIDIRYDLMAKVIIGGSNTLVKFILFGDEKVKHKYLHIPRITRWTDSEGSNIMDDNPEKSVDGPIHKASLISRIYSKFKSPTKKKRTIYTNKLSDLEIAINMCKSGNLII